MKNRRSLTFAVMVFLCCFISSNAVAQEPLNQIRIDQCNPNKPPDKNTLPPSFDSADLAKLIETERKRGLVLEARRFAIDQATGKINFNGNIGRVSVVNMNPFVYRYEISVKQAELVSSAVSDFIDILLPPALRSVGVLKSEKARFAAGGTAAGNIDKIWSRLNFTCTTGDDCVALNTMKDEAGDIKTKLGNFTEITGKLPDEVSTLTDSITKLRDEQADAYTTCVQARDVNVALASYKPTGHVSDLEVTQKNLAEVRSIASDLGTLATEFIADDELNKSTIRCGGFNCANQFNAYAAAVIELVDKVYKPVLDNRLDTWRQFQALLDLTNKMKGKEGLFARTFEVRKKFELSEATISVARKKVEPEKNNPASAQRDATRQGDDTTPPNNDNPFEEQADGNGDKGDKKPDEDKKDKDKDAKSEPSPALNADINEPIRIGRPRFLVSGGLVYAPLARQSFESGTGFSRDAQGNPVGDPDKKIISFEENSPRRLLPMVFLNSRLVSFSPASIYFTLGVTAKHDKDIDVEYLLGPSVSMLNDRAMFTFGAYAGKTQRLVPDVKIGDEIPDSAGNASLTTKRYTWKPGFSFSYVFSNLSKRSEEADSGGSGGNTRASASAADELKDEIRIGGIPFNLAMGLAYTSVEDRTFDEVLGFARDRQGNLTNGQTLTRIVGLSSSSNYRLVPLAMLHSRLLNFGDNYSFYLTSGVTGKKDDDNVQLEYLLGGSVNLYRRKLFFTFGAFAGKQQELGGDLFLGGKLNPAQDVNVHSRYVWKPAFAFSYDISKILPAGSKK